jgi:hypothetical protein
MKTFAVFDKSTGVVLRTGICGDRDFDTQADASANESIAETEIHYHPDKCVADPATGAITAKTEVSIDL